ncbi:glycosyltransferase [Aerosakkonema funiforme]|uniref:Glycosyltransferase n=1 Tax=Aerosakkonema funiforme FACHB-1375 TaxID=2949571 RepID=A0A926VFZ8_9CYAN|nr:glycosyltransferase [Aerosakkonema funiforme]MBD2182998.1 glycosyltransferase [Aerosakkonema funiforme FACHB-1375]
MIENSLLVSVIIAVKNGERRLGEAIESILSQTYKEYEILVVDGQSTDNTEKIAKSYDRVRYIRQTGKGLADAWNLGIEAAKGELIAFLDSDDLWTPNKLSLQVDYLVNHPLIQYAIGKFRFILEPGCPIPIGFKKELLDKDIVGPIPGTLIVRKSLLNSIGKFNTDLVIASDVDWFARVKDENIPMIVIPEVLLYKRVHTENLSSNAEKNNQELLQLLKQSINRQRRSQISEN